MEIYSLHNNNEAVIEYYELYNKLSKTFKNKYRIEIIRLQTLYFLGKYEECRENIENILMVAMNKELLSYSLNCLGKIEKDQLNDKNKAYYYFFNNFYFYRENDFSFESLLNLYALAKGAEKLYLANSILSKKEFVFLDTFLKEEITEYSKKGKGYITSIPDNGFEKPYYYISCIVVLKKEINSTQFQDIFDKFKKILEINNYPLYFQETEKYYIYGVGPYHFYEDSLKTKNDLELKGIDCSIIALDYTF